MKLTSQLARSQIKVNRRRTVWTLLGIVFSSAMLTAVSGFIASGDAMLKDIIGGNYYDRALYMSTLFGLGGVLGAIIAIVSVVVISNAFRVSAGERTAQFGMLKSVGGTKKQIAEIVMYEGVWLSVIGIPVGVVLGIVIHFLGIEIANFLLTGVNRLNSDLQSETEVMLVLTFVFKWWAIAASIVASFLTVMVSAWLPARKAAKIAAIDAIRGAGDIKVKAKQVKGGRLIGRLFGFEGALASKSLKRSRRNFRATVVSLTVSMIIYIVVNSLLGQMGTVMNMIYPNITATAVIRYSPHAENGYPELDSLMTRDLTMRLREYPNAKVFGAGSGGFGQFTILPGEMLTPQMREAIETSPQHSFKYDESRDEYKLYVAFVVADEENYIEMCERAGVPYGSNILVNHCMYRIRERRSEFKPYVFTNQTLNVGSYIEGEPPLEIPLHGELDIGDVPFEVHYAGDNDVIIVMPRYDIYLYNWFTDVADVDGFIEFANSVFGDYSNLTEQGEIEATNIKVMADAQRDLYRLVMVFVYGFVGLLTLIALTNVISTISTNVRSRAREFAILQSVGMTQGGIKRMLNLESVLCSIKALVVGLPLGVVATALAYRSFYNSFYFAYDFPWTGIIHCVAGVLVITWFTMRYAVSRLRGGNIVETIRGDM